MARSVKAKFGGKAVALRATFGAAKDISDEVCDLLTMQREQAAALIFMQRGMPYTPKFAFTVDHVVTILDIALRHADVGLGRDAVEAFVIDEGIDTAQDIATEYLRLYWKAGPEKEPEKKEAEPGK